MRITNNIIQRSSLTSMQTNLKQIAAAEEQVSSGRRINRASDDPVAASTAMAARSSVRALEQYQRNIGGATARANAEEQVLDQITDVLGRIKELGISQNTGTASPQSRQVAKAEVDSLLEHLVALGNTRHGDRYLFGGTSGQSAPFDLSQTAQTPLYVSIDPDTGAPRLPVGSVSVEIEAGRHFEVTHDGQEVFVESGLFEAVRSLSEALASPDPAAEIPGALTALDSAFSQVQRLVGEIGARTNQLEVTHANLDALDVTLKTLKSDLEEVDFELAVTELVNRQTAYQAALLATSKVMGLTLADYIR